MKKKCKHKKKVSITVAAFAEYEDIRYKCCKCGKLFDDLKPNNPMKIEVKISNDTFQILEQMLRNVKFNPNATKEVKLYTSVLLELSGKIVSKAHKINSQMTIFDAKTKHKLALKYHEAFSLHQILASLNESLNLTDTYKYNLLQKFLHELNQKIC